MPDLSAADIAEGRRLDKLATGKPWETYVSRTDVLPGRETREIVRPNGDLHPWNVLKAGNTCCWPPTGSDAELIVWARNHLSALLDAAEKAAESSDRQKAMRLAEHGTGHTPQERWRDASRAARASEHHWPADCLAEAADVLDSLLEERAAVRALANRWATQSNDYDEDTEQQIEDGREILELLGEEVDSDA